MSAADVGAVGILIGSALGPTGGDTLDWGSTATSGAGGIAGMGIGRMLAAKIADAALRKLVIVTILTLGWSCSLHLHRGPTRLLIAARPITAAPKWSATTPLHPSAS